MVSVSLASQKLGVYVGSRENFSKNLKARIAELKVRQKDFALRVGVTESVVSQWINGVSIPEWDRLDHVASVLFCDPEYFLRDPKKNTKKEERKRIETETRVRIAKDTLAPTDYEVVKKS